MVEVSYGSHKSNILLLTTIRPLQDDGCKAGKQCSNSLAIARALGTSGVFGDTCFHTLVPHLNPQTFSQKVDVTLTVKYPFS